MNVDNVARVCYTLITVEGKPIKTKGEFTMKYVTAGYEPQDVLQYFEDLARIPRGSGNCAAVAEYVYNWGKELGLDAIHDTVHEMAKDEARHGRGFDGLLARYFA